MSFLFKKGVVIGVASQLYGTVQWLDLVSRLSSAWGVSNLPFPYQLSWEELKADHSLSRVKAVFLLSPLLLLQRQNQELPWRDELGNQLRRNNERPKMTLQEMAHVCRKADSDIFLLLWNGWLKNYMGACSANQCNCSLLASLQKSLLSGILTAL